MRFFILVILPMLSSACSTVVLNQNFSNFSLEDEKFMAKETLPLIRQDYPALQDENVQNYISDLGQYIVSHSNLSQNSYDFTFTVVNAPDIHAFSIPAGHVFVTAELLRFVETEDELASILAHEIAHIYLQHTAKKINSVKAQKNQSWWYAGGGAVVGGAVGIAAASTVCMNNSICTAQLVGLGSIAGIHGGIFAQKYFFLTQSQDNELAADSLGYKIAQRAGFRAEKIARFFEKIDQIKFKKNTKPQFSLNSLINNISTHPSKEDRLKLLQELQLQNNTESISQRSSSNFIDIQKQLLVR